MQVRPLKSISSKWQMLTGYLVTGGNCKWYLES